MYSILIIWSRILIKYSLYAQHFMKYDGELPVVLRYHPLSLSPYFGLCSQLHGFPSSLPCALIMVSTSHFFFPHLYPLTPGPSAPSLKLSPLPSLMPSLSAAGRDLKLENLLLDKRENVKISDFGFAKMVPSNQPVGRSSSYRQVNCFSHLSQTYCGSFAYACPEILLGLPYNPFLSDTWSMGVILYTLMVARLPFDDTNLKKLLRETQKEVTFPANHTISQECKVLAT